MNSETIGTPARRGLVFENFDAEVRKHISKDSLGLGPLVDQKRMKYGIVDAAWYGQQPLFDRVLVWQISEDEGETYNGGIIVKTEVARKRELVEAPRGVIVGAGLGALDVLRSNGVDIGHTVGFTRLAPFRRPIGVFAGVPLALIVLHVGDLVDSEDLGSQLKSRTVRVLGKDDEGLTRHYFVDANGKAWTPVGADMPEDA
jgi:co-chaperonin GroES (HSP10)